MSDDYIRFPEDEQKFHAAAEGSKVPAEGDKNALLACPFCGADAELDTKRPYRPINGQSFGEEVAIYCTNESGCPADMSVCKEDAPGATTEQLVNELTDLWNRRAS